jgi:PAS domain S-box-containing protein
MRASTMSAKPTRGELEQRIKELECEAITSKWVEDVLLKKRDFIDTLIYLSPSLFAAISPEGKTIMMSEAMLQVLGYTLKEVIGTDYLKTFIPESERSMLSEVFTSLIQSRKPTFVENHILTKDGNEILLRETTNLMLFFSLPARSCINSIAECALRSATSQEGTSFVSGSMATHVQTSP